MIRPHANPLSKNPIPVPPEKVGAFLAGVHGLRMRQKNRADIFRSQLLEELDKIGQVRIGDLTKIAKRLGTYTKRVSVALAAINGGPLFPSKGNARRGKKFPRKALPE
jgi:hypothetical protein